MTTPTRHNGALTVSVQGNTPGATKAPRMTLSSVTRGVMAQPLRVVIYGPGGVGKSTFGAQAPNPIFLGPEDGSALLDVARFPQPESWSDVMDALRVLTSEAHEYQTLAIDSLDWLEPLCWEHTCRSANKKSIEDFGYGKGYLAAIEEWRRFISALDNLRRVRRMHVVLIAHTIVATFKNPEGEDYDRFTLKLHKAASGLFTEWCDELVFANFKTHALKVDPKGARGKGYGSERVLYTERRAAFDAKSRHGLPPEMPLSWTDFYDLTRRNAGEVIISLRAEIDTALTTLTSLDASAGEKARAVYENAPSDAGSLSTVLNRITAGINARRSASATND